MKSSPSIWRSVVNVKSMVEISSNFVVFFENMNFYLTRNDFTIMYACSLLLTGSTQIPTSNDSSAQGLSSTRPSD